MNDCLLCGKANLEKLLNFGEHPIAHHFLDNPREKECVHPVVLSFCGSCGLVQLIDPIPPDLLYTNYICLSSWKYQPHIPRLVEMIEESTGVKKTCRILEVGSNDGIFLDALRRKGYRNIIGIEPAGDAREAADRKGLTTIPSYFTPKTAKEFVSSYGKCDLFVSRQMLEHVNDIKGFREAMRIVLSDGGYAVFEVPNFIYNLDTPDYTIWEEHINYFTLDTIKLFLSMAGIRITHSETTLFSGETLTVIGQHVGDNALPPAPIDYIKTLRKKVLNYRDRWPVFRNAFIRYLHEHKKKGKRIAAYGAGCRLCSFINFVGLEPYIEFIVDDQPEKQGKYMPGSKLAILPADALEKKSIDLCLLGVNAESEDKVISKHPDLQKKGGIFISVLPPSDRLPHFWRKLCV